MRRENGIVGSIKTITKRNSETPEFYANVGSLLGTNEIIGSIADIVITATTATVSDIGKIGKIIRYTLDGGTVGTTDTITITFNSTDVDGNLIGDPTVCTALIRNIA